MNRIPSRLLALLAGLCVALMTGVLPPATAHAQSTAPDCEPLQNQFISSGDTLTWGLKKSFRTYLTGPIARGSATVADGAEDAGEAGYRFSAGRGLYSMDSHALVMRWQGSVHFRGHHGALDVMMSDLALELPDGRAGTLHAHLRGKTLSGESFDVADLPLAKVTVERGRAFTSSSVTLTKDGAKAFSDFYAEGTELDPLSFTFTMKKDGTSCDAPAPINATGFHTGASGEPPIEGGQPGGSNPDDGVQSGEAPQSGEANGTHEGGQPGDGDVHEGGPRPRVGVEVLGANGESMTEGTTGSAVILRATGFTSGEKVTFEIHSDPVVLGTVDADGSGVAEWHGTLPASITTGVHTVHARGASGTATAPLTLRTAAPITTDEATRPAPSTPSAPVPTCAPDPNKFRFTGGALDWGVREKFRNYIRGSIAKGGWETGRGAAWNGTAQVFTFPVSSGWYDASTRTGRISYVGTVHFTGHGGVLDLTISDPTIVINRGSGTLEATVSSSDTSGKRTNHGRVSVLTLTGVSVNAALSGTAISASGASLNAGAVPAFAGFYEAGEAMDGLSSSLATAPGTACDPTTGQLIDYTQGGLAATGADATGLLLAAGLALGLGSLLLVGGRCLRTTR